MGRARIRCARHRGYQSEGSRRLGFWSVPGGGESVEAGSATQAGSSVLALGSPLAALSADCTPRTGKRTRSSPRLTTIRSGFTAYRTTPSTTCWPSAKGAAGRSSTEISAVLDADVIITPLTANLNSLQAASGVRSPLTTGAGLIGVRCPEKEGSLGFASGLAVGAGDGSDCQRDA